MKHKPWLRNDKDESMWLVMEIATELDKTVFINWGKVCGLNII